MEPSCWRGTKGALERRLELQEEEEEEEEGQATARKRAEPEELRGMPPKEIYIAEPPLWKEQPRQPISQTAEEAV